jgi:probable selenium-dependent hydroxylase accessory protein YqeC
VHGPDLAALGDLATTGLDVRRGELVALVGAGGKTTLLRAVGAALGARGWRVLLTTTTKVGREQMAEIPEFWSARAEGDHLIGPPSEEVDRAWATGSYDAVVVEADGARHRLVKAPDEHEPVIPARTTLVVAVIGADAIGQVIADVAHRPEQVAHVAGCRTADRLTVPRAVRLAGSEQGLRKGVPASGRFAVAVTRVRADDARQASALVEALAAAGIDATALPWVE